MSVKSRIYVSFLDALRIHVYSLDVSGGQVGRRAGSGKAAGSDVLVFLLILMPFPKTCTLGSSLDEVQPEPALQFCAERCTFRRLFIKIFKGPIREGPVFFIDSKYDQSVPKVGPKSVQSASKVCPKGLPNPSSQIKIVFLFEIDGH